jgi:hypothetical protein
VGDKAKANIPGPGMRLGWMVQSLVTTGLLVAPPTTSGLWMPGWCRDGPSCWTKTLPMHDDLVHGSLARNVGDGTSFLRRRT